MHHETPAPGGRKTRKYWSNQHHALQRSLDSGESLQGVARAYGITPRHMRRVFTSLGITYVEPAEITRIKKSNEHKARWLTWECKRLQVEAWHRENMEVYLAIPDNCPVTGDPLLFSCQAGVTAPNRAMLTLQEADSWYVDGNVEVLSLEGVYYMTQLPKAIWGTLGKYLTSKIK